MSDLPADHDEWMDALLRTVRLEAIGQVTGNAAHEINNALSLVTGYAELVLAGELEPEIRRNLESVLYGGRQAVRVAENLRWFARRLRAGWGKFDVNALVGDCAALLRRSCEQQDVMLLEDLQPELPQGKGHVGQLQLVILSMMQQSVERLIRREVNGIIQVRTGEEGGHLVVQVEDDGPGLAEKEQKALLAETIDHGPEEGCIGLGLGLCRRIASAHGGTIRMSSDEEGVCMTLELPAGGGA